MTEDFSLIHAFTAKWEGGISNHPADPGGLTVYGVCLSFFKDFGRRKPQFLAALGLAPNREALLTLTRAQAAAIFKEEFYRGLEDLPLPIRAVAYDSGVNCGRVTGRKFIQKGANAALSRTGEITEKNRLDVDGIIGPKTLAACRLAPQAIAQAGIRARKDYYQAIISRNPKLSAFQKGWLNRANDLASFVKSL